MALGQARTDLYGIGKGEAQIFDTSQTDNLVTEQRRVAQKAIETDAANVEKQRVRDENQARKREDQMINTLAKVSGLKYKPGDDAYFRKQISELSETFAERLDGDDMSVSSDLWVDFSMQASRIINETSLSKKQLDDALYNVKISK